MLPSRPSPVLPPLLPPVPLLLSLLAAGVLLAPPAASQDAPERGSEPPAQVAGSGEPQPSQESLPAVRAELEVARERLRAAPEDARPPHLAREVEILERVEAQVAQGLRLVESRPGREEARRQLEGELEELEAAGVPGAVPHPFLALEAARDQLWDAETRRTRGEEALRLARDALRQAREDHDVAERARRRARDDADAAPESGGEASALRLAALESRAAAETVHVRRLELEALEHEQEGNVLRERIARGRVEYLRDRSALTDEDRASILLGLARDEEAQRRASELAQRALDQVDSEWVVLKGRLDEQGGSDLVLTEELEALRAAQRYRRRELDGIARRLERVAERRRVHERRFQLFEGEAPRRELAAWRTESERALRDLDLEQDLAAGRTADLRREIAALDERIAAEAGPEVLAALRRQRRHLTAATAVLEEDGASIHALRRQHEKLLADLGERLRRFDLWRAAVGLWERVAAVWRYELTAVDDQAITIGKVVTGLFLLVFGVCVSGRLSRIVGARLLPRLRLHEGAAHALQSLLFYLLVITAALFALRVVSVPLTAFTILGGALAIGVGFGSQNVVNNFISGLILLAERPVRPGDLIQIGEIYGTVAHIGPRSTRVQTGENVEIIVPNSSFLEQNVVNWTLSSTKVRVSVAVGVVYGSPTREVRELLRRAVAEHGRILNAPEPLVLFTSFGDSSLEFEVHFWIHMRSLMDRRLVESDVRFRIDSLCREAGIVIAFPQRDVHLDSSRPLEVRLLDGRGAEREGNGR